MDDGKLVSGFVEAVAKNIELVVQHAWEKVLRRRGRHDHGEIYDSVLENVRSSMHHPGKWFPGTPTKVVVSSEGGLIGDPLRSEKSKQEWDEVVRLIKSIDQFEDAGWESHNAAVHYIWVRPVLSAKRR